VKTVVIERSAVGGQASTSSRIENYLGFPKGIDGSELPCRAREQAPGLELRSYCCERASAQRFDLRDKAGGR
jgi:thioredoxin reductase